MFHVPDTDQPGLATVPPITRFEQPTETPSPRRIEWGIVVRAEEVAEYEPRGEERHRQRTARCPSTLTGSDRGALLALARDGFAGVAVEPLARKLGATKGSFYWHFATRAELIAATLELWEQRETTR